MEQNKYNYFEEEKIENTKLQQNTDEFLEPIHDWDKAEQKAKNHQVLFFSGILNFKLIFWPILTESNPCR